MVNAQMWRGTKDEIGKNSANEAWIVTMKNHFSDVLKTT